MDWLKSCMKFVEEGTASLGTPGNLTGLSSADLSLMGINPCDG